MNDKLSYPWWGIAAVGPIEKIRSEVLRVVSRLRLSYAPGQFGFVPGESWTGVFFFKREPPVFEIPNALRELSFGDVIVMTLDDYPTVSRWDGGGWVTVDDPYANRFAEEHGIKIPGAMDPTAGRASRSAALVVGVPPERIRGLVNASAQVIESARGAVILEDIDFDEEKISGATIVYRTHRFLDDGAFTCDVGYGEEIAQYRTAGETIKRIERLSNVEGETDPRTIVRKLGIPEDWMFPPSDN